MREIIQSTIEYKTIRNMPLRIICILWILITFIVYWLLKNTRGITLLTDSPPEFIIEMSKAVTQFFTAEYLY